MEMSGRRIDNSRDRRAAPPGRGPSRRAGRRRDLTMMAVMIVLALIMTAAAALAMFNAVWQPNVEDPGGTVSDPGIPSDAPISSQGFEEMEPKVSGDRKSRNIYTFLVVGKDVAYNNTDTMMIGTYDVTNQRATVMSLPRDTLVNVKSSSVYTRLNAVWDLYGQGERGMAALTREVSELVGFIPDFRVFVDWKLVGEMVDAIGGVWYDVPRRMKYDDPIQDLHIDQEPGYRLISGDDAMQIVRWRKNNDGVDAEGPSGSDIVRLDIQHSFLKAVLKQTLQIQNVPRIRELAELFNSRVESNLEPSDLLWFAQKAVFGGLDVDGVEFITMPYYYFDVYVCPNQAKLLEVINEKLNPYVTEVTIDQLDLISGNEDGSLSSSTGTLADPRAGRPQR